MQLNDRSVAFDPGCGLAVHAFLDLSVHALFDHYVTELIFACLAELLRCCLHVDISFSHIVDFIATLLSLAPALSFLLGLASIQMLVSFQKSVLDPEHQRVQHKWDEHHHHYQLNLRVAFENDKRGGPCSVKLLIVGILDEKDDDFGDELAYAPDSELDKPCAQVDMVIRVDIVIIDRHIFIRVHATFQNLNTELDSGFIDNFEAQISDECAEADI
mmetsp:Transcript_8305/g.11493  ORF Transcript_8305/g.11493 Transcript_8305/m.11493 type:complete len:216 (-) Transcript_8305:329-976(-)